MIRQRADPVISAMITYLENQNLPDDDRSARALILHAVVGGVLYHLAQDKTLRVVVPIADRQQLVQQAHGGNFTGHLGEAKIYGMLSKQYWWPQMRRDIAQWCKSCLSCATRQVGRAVKPPLTPMPVGGPFDRVRTDVVQLPVTRKGNKHAVVFMDYLTKWPEVFPTMDQTTPTIAKLLVEEIISHHGVPSELLLDRGPSFLSGLMEEIYSAMGIHKVNTTTYHPQTNGLVERFIWTLIDMLSKTTDSGEQDWGLKLPFILFAYRATPQASTGESPFFLLYGRDPRLPTEAALSPLWTVSYSSLMTTSHWLLIK